MIDNYETEHFDEFLEHRKKSFFYKGRAMIIEALLGKKIAGLLAGSNGIRVVDIGFGHGTEIPKCLLDRSELVGVDINFNSLSQIKKLGNSSVIFVNADVLDLPFKESFDVALLLDVLEHIEDDGKALASIQQVLKKDGILIIMVPAMPSMYGRFDKLAFHKRRYSAKDLKSKLTRAGFTVTKISYFFFFIFPFIYLFRKMREVFFSISRKEDSSITDMAEIRVIPGINEVGLATLMLESGLIKKISFPFGSSIVAIATAKKLVGAE